MINLIVITVCVYFFISWLKMIWTRRTLKGPFPLPVVGHGYKFVVDAPGFFKKVEEIVTTYDDYALIYIFNTRYIISTNLKYNEAIVSNTDYNTKGISYYYIEPWLGQGLLTSSGNRWKTHRKFLTPAFHFNILQNFLPVFCKNTRILIKKLKDLKNEEYVNMFPVIALAALDNVTESIMGVSVNAQCDSESAYVRAIEDLTELIATRMRNPFVGEDVIFNLLPHRKRQERALEVLHGQTRKVIESRREDLKAQNITSLPKDCDFGIKNKHAFLDLLLLSEVNGQKIDDEKVREEVDTFMFEGHDTTTSGITFALLCLAKNPEVQDKILNELRTIYGDNMDRDPTHGELKEMKYLELVIKESLRLYPSVPIIQRMITQDCQIAGLNIPKNTSILIDIYHMQRRADLYDNPLEFRPERFNDPDNKNPFKWLAFSAGPRNCIGQKFAMMEMKVVISEIAKNFVILPTDREPMLTIDLILRSRNGVNLKLRPRN